MVQMGDTELWKGCPPPRFDPCEVVEKKQKEAARSTA